MNKWIAEFELEDGDTMPEHMDLEYKGAKIDFHCKPLEQEPTNKNDLGVDCISRKIMRDLGATCIAYRNDKQELIPIVSIDELSSVTPQEPKTGHWILRPHIYGVAFCSECGFELRVDNTNYCPNCGAKMVEP